MPGKYSINDLERLTGIKAHTLRIWEQRYNILHPKRTSTNIRFYNNSDLKRILNISLLNNHGYKISKIATLSEAEIVREAEKLLSQAGKEDTQIEKLVFCMMDMDAVRFADIFSDCVARFGFEHTMESIIFPFMRHAGNMWQVGTINPAQEHFISNLIRQKLVAAIDAFEPDKAQSKKAVLFLPYGEYHELALLYCDYLCKSKGFHCIYLGSNVPVEDIQFVFLNYKPDLLITVITANLDDSSLEDYLKTLNAKLPGANLLLSGRLAIQESEGLKLPKTFKVFKDFSALKELL
jgi:DNA-binding transcriptional MerR regulator